MRSPFLERLDQGPVLSDGAVGTMLYELGVPYGRSFDELNLTDPDVVSRVHRGYLQVGAEMLTTNTFGATRIRLAEFGLESKTRAINLRGVKIAREAREIEGVPAFIAGSVGPAGRPFGRYTRELKQHLLATYSEQVEALLEGGADLITLETFSDLNDITTAIRAARAVCELPVVAQMTFGEDGVTLTGNTPEEVAAALLESGADVIGINCSVGPQGVLESIHRMRSAGVERLAAQPNAGLPSKRGQHFVYISTPEYFGEYASRFMSAGVSLIGGCCGTAPDHIAMMAAALQKTPADSPHVEVREAPVSVEYGPVSLDNEPAPSRFAQALSSGEFVISVELDPPKGLNPTKVLRGAAMLEERGVRFVNIADSPMARVRMGCIALARLVQEHTSLESIIHFTTRDRNLMALQSELLGARALGIRNVIALTGDPPGLGDYPDSTGVWDIDSVGLIETLTNMNEGVDRAGRSIGRKGGFCIAAAVDPTAEDVEFQIERMWRKIEAGAHLLMCQPLYDAESLYSFLDRVGPLPVPFLLGVLPLQSSRHAEFMHNEVPGIRVPDSVRAAMRDAGADGIAMGIRLAQEFVHEVQDRVQGMYLMPSFGRYEVCAEIIDALDLDRKGETDRHTASV